MPRRKGQTSQNGPALWAMAYAVPACSLKRYMCELGPRFCPICFSKCAFGERYLALRRAEKEQRAACNAAALKTKAI